MGSRAFFTDPSNNIVGYGLFVYPGRFGFRYMHSEDCGAGNLLRRYHTFIDNYDSGQAD